MKEVVLVQEPNFGAYVVRVILQEYINREGYKLLPMGKKPTEGQIVIRLTENGAEVWLEGSKKKEIVEENIAIQNRSGFDPCAARLSKAIAQSIQKL